MSRLTSDPLLTAARLVIGFIMVMSIIAITAICIGATVIAFMHGQVVTMLAEHGAPAVAYWAILAAMVLIAGGIMLGYRFVQELRRIVDSVGEGDPFVPANADRLQRMGWLVLIIQVVTLPAGILAAWIGSVTEKGDIDVNFSPGGLVLMLVLFILARVFRRGAEMREELEGTV